MDGNRDAVVGEPVHGGRIGGDLRVRAVVVDRFRTVHRGFHAATSARAPGRRVEPCSAGGRQTSDVWTLSPTSATRRSTAPTFVSSLGIIGSTCPVPSTRSRVAGDRRVGAVSLE